MNKQRMMALVAGFSAVLVITNKLAIGQQLDETCVVNVLNRTVQVNADGGWSMPNVPSTMGQVRARATCVRDGQTVSGQTDYFAIVRNGITQTGEFNFDVTEPPPTAISFSGAGALIIQGVGTTANLAVSATYPDGSSRDVTEGVSGINYTSSNPAIASVDADGRVTAHATGGVLTTARLDGAVAVKQVTTVSGGDADNDGLPDDYEQANGLNPNDPVDAHEDRDRDGLSAFDEFNLGTDPNNPDTDGDSITDGEEANLGEDGFVTNPLDVDTDGDGLHDALEIQIGSSPVDAADRNLAAALSTLEVTPASTTIVFNTIDTEATAQLTVTGTLIDGNELDLTSTSTGTSYNSSDFSVASLGGVSGQVFAGQSGTAGIQVANSGFSDTATVTVVTFDPVALSVLSIPGYANNVETTDGHAFVAAGSAGLQIVDVSVPETPQIASAIDTPGTAIDVRLDGDLAYLADGETGLQIVDIADPLNPSLVGSADTSGVAQDLQVGDGHAFVADGPSGLQIIDVFNPGLPQVVGTLGGLGDAKGVAIEGNTAVIVSNSGLFVIDVTNKAAPILLGQNTGLGANLKDVELRDGVAYVAGYSDGWKIIDLTTPSSPTQIGGNTGSGDFAPRDVALGEKYAFYAEQLFPNAVAYVNIEQPDASFFQGIVDLSPLGDFAHTGIALDPSYAYVTGESFFVGQDYGVSGDTALMIAQYRMLEDNGSIAPTVSIVSPAYGDTLIEGETVTFEVDATDDVHVSAVSFLVNGENLSTDTAAPFQVAYTVPVAASGLTLDAEAIDLAGNVGVAETVVVDVIPDPKTTVIGRVLDDSQLVVNGATVTCQSLSTTTDSTGVFSVSDVPTLNPIACNAYADAQGRNLTGSSASIAPIRGGTTNVGDIVIAEARFETDLGTNLQQSDDDYDFVQFQDGFSFPFFGTSYTGVYVSSNGRLTFTYGDATYYETIADFASQPQIAAFFDDLYPYQGGVYVNPQPDRVVVTWYQVPHFAYGGSNTIQAVLYSDGKIQIGYNGTTALNNGIIAGVSPGAEPLLERDLSAETPFSTNGPIAVFEQFTEDFGGANADPFDLDNQFVIFQPNISGGYDVSTRPLQ